jgi:putative transposase
MSDNFNTPSSNGKFPRGLVSRTFDAADDLEVATEELDAAREAFSGSAPLHGYEATRARERGMRRFKSMKQAQRVVTAHAAVSNLFNLGRHLLRAQHYRDLRTSAFEEWNRAVT